MALLCNQENSLFEQRPMMLKDFLRDDRLHSYPSPSSSSSSSNGFHMYPREKPYSKSNNKPPIVLLRSWSRKAAATRISAVHKVINAVKFLHFGSSKSPLLLTRSISRKLPKKSGKDKNVISSDVPAVNNNKVKVKDILRWRSFRDVVEDYSPPLDFPSSPSRSTTATTSWCFTADELQLWGGGDNGDICGKKSFTAEKSTGTNYKGDWSFEECEQQSPVSVLDTPFREVDQQPISPFHPTRIANIGRAKCMPAQRIQEFEGTTKSKYTRNLDFCGEIVTDEQKAKELLNHIKEDDISQLDDEHVILDFFKHELLPLDGNNLDNVEFDYDQILIRVAKSWLNGEFDESYDWEVEDKRESYVKDMEKTVCWKHFRQEQEIVSRELEIKVLNELLDELLMDL